MNRDSKYTLEAVKRCLMQMATQRRLLTVSFEDELHYHRNYLLKAGWAAENFQVSSLIFGETFKSVQYNSRYVSILPVSSTKRATRRKIRGVHVILQERNS